MRLQLAAAFIGATSLTGCSDLAVVSHPLDQEVIEEFGRQRAELVSLAIQATSEPGVISTSEFRERTRSLGIEMVQLWGGPQSPEVRFVLSSEGGVPQGSSKGLTYSHRDPAPQLESLDGSAVAPYSEGFHRIEGDWHIFLTRW